MARENNGNGRSASWVSKSLRGMDFPKNKRGVVNYAQEHDADSEVLDALKHLPDKQYNNMNDVEREVASAK